MGAVEGGLYTPPKFGKYSLPASETQLARPCATSLEFLRADGIEIRENTARQNAIGVRQSILSKMWSHPAHGYPLTFYTHALSAPEDENDLFFGLTESSLPWTAGRTVGTDCRGRLRMGSQPSCTTREPFAELPRPAPKTATFKVRVDFATATATIAAFPTFSAAIIDEDMIFQKNIDINAWKSARLWVSVGAQNSVVCLARVVKH